MKTSDKRHSIGEPERPIKSATEDQLGRETFVDRLVSALINQETGRSTGVVIGITGPWGSGKTSLLNLLDECIRRKHRKALVVRFDPWLVSGRNDLISEFIAELLGTINSKPSLGSKMRGLATAVAKYGAHVAPAGDIALLGAGSAVQGGLRAVEAALKRDESLHARRERVTQELQKAALPIVVFIDELDRVEDDEVRTVAQLVRSIADFPSISYVLAYDPERVIQALGGGSEPDRLERGRAYLEKIVQLQLPLPITLPEEVQNLLRAELDAIQVDAKLPQNWSSDGAFSDLSEILVPQVIGTPRDIKRLIGTFHVYASMLADEVDWIDLLAFSALVVKAPRTVENIRRSPDDVVEDPRSLAAHMRRMALDKRPPSERIADIRPKDEGGAGVVELLSFLFPFLSDNGRRARERGAGALCRRRPLLTALRLGLLPGDYSRSDLRRTLSKARPEIVADLTQMHESDSIATFLDRLEEVYPTLTNGDDEDFWCAAAEFLEKPDCEWWTSFSTKYSLPRAFEDIFARRVLRSRSFNARKVFDALREQGSVMLTAELLRSQIFANGLFGHPKREDREGAFMDASETQKAAEELSAIYRARHLNGRFVSCLWNLTPVYTMVECGAWDEICRRHMLNQLSDPVALDGFTLLMFGPGYATTRDTVEKIIGYDALATAVRARLESPSLTEAHETVRVALEKAIDDVWIR